jgi:hypothetical protein
MRYWLHVGHEALGGDLYGSYDTPGKAAQAGVNIMLEAFRQEDVFDRTFRIVEAEGKDQAEAKVLALADGFDEDEKWDTSDLG